MTIFFTSDLHLGHQNIIKYCNRPWKYWDEMDEVLISNHNEIITDEDVVYYLGDFCWKSDPAKYLSRLKGKEHHLILGNHDNKNKCAGVFSSVNDVKLLNMKGYPNIWLSHYAHRVWPASHYGSIHLFGHSHGNLATHPDEKCMDVGVDCFAYYPVSLDQIILLFGIDKTDKQ